MATCRRDEVRGKATVVQGNPCPHELQQFLFVASPARFGEARLLIACYTMSVLGVSYV